MGRGMWRCGDGESNTELVETTDITAIYRALLRNMAIDTKMYEKVFETVAGADMEGLCCYVYTDRYFCPVMLLMVRSCKICSTDLARL